MAKMKEPKTSAKPLPLTVANVLRSPMMGGPFANITRGLTSAGVIATSPKPNTARDDRADIIAAKKVNAQSAGPGKYLATLEAQHENAQRIKDQAAARSASSAGLDSSAASADPFRLGIDLPGDPTAAELAAYLKRAQQMGAIEYDPKINALVRTQQQAKETEKRNQGMLSDLYKALGASISAGGKEAGAETAADIKGTQAQYAGLAQQIAGEYSKSLEEQKTGAALLNSTEGIADTLAQQGEDRSLTQSLAAQQGQNVTDALQIMGAGAQQRMTEFGAMAQGEGATRKADLAESLRQILYQTGGSIADLQGAKGKFIRELANQYQDEDFNRKMAIAAEKRLQAEGEAGINLRAAELEFNKEKAYSDAQAEAAKTAAEAAAKPPPKVVGMPYEALMDAATPVVAEWAKQHPNDITGGDISNYDAIFKAVMNDPELAGLSAEDAKLGGRAPFVTIGKIAQLMHKYNKRENIDKGGWERVNPGLLDAFATEFYNRIVKGQGEFNTP